MAELEHADMSIDDHLLKLEQSGTSQMHKLSEAETEYCNTEAEVQMQVDENARRQANNEENLKEIRSLNKILKERVQNLENAIPQVLTQFDQIQASLSKREERIMKSKVMSEMQQTAQKQSLPCLKQQIADYELQNMQLQQAIEESVVQIQQLLQKRSEGLKDTHLQVNELEQKITDLNLQIIRCEHDLEDQHQELLKPNVLDASSLDPSYNANAFSNRTIPLSSSPAHPHPHQRATSADKRTSTKPYSLAQQEEDLLADIEETISAAHSKGLLISSASASKRQRNSRSWREITFDD